MDSSTLFMIVIFLLIVVGMYFFNRNRGIAPRGTYDDKDYRSGGSIGGGQRTYDDPDYRSSGSIGGTGGSSSSGGSSGTRSYDDPDYKSGGSIGG